MTGPTNNNTTLTKNMAGMSDLPDELLALIAEYLSTSLRDIHTCVFLNHTLSSFFISCLWRNIDILHCYPKEPKLYHFGRFARFKAASIDTGGLARNGRFIRTLRGVSADWLPFFGPNICPFLECVEIDGYNDHQEDKESTMKGMKKGRVALAAFLGQHTSGTLRKLSLARNILWCRTEEQYLALMRVIPQSVEELRLYQWDGNCSGDEDTGNSGWGQYIDIEDVQNFQYEYPRLRAAAAAATTALIPEPTSTIRKDRKDILPNIKKLVLEYSIIDGIGLDRLLSWIPGLESLAIYGSSIPHVFDFTRTLRDSCPLLTALNISSTNNNKGMASLPGLAYPVLLCASLRGWRTLALSSDKPVNAMTLWQASLFHHVNTLETLYLEGFHTNTDDDDTFMGQLLGSSPRLKHFIVAHSKDYGMTWSKISETSDWVCRDLEVFRVPFIYLGYTFDDGEERNRFQQQLYRQLARLTNLKELVFGEMEDDELFLDNGDGYGGQRQPQYHQPIISDNIHPQDFLVNDFYSPEMTLESGMGVLKDLKQLRRVGLKGVQPHAFLKSEEDRVWVKENWPLLQQEYRNDFWKVFRRW
ncbi:hypothetical protein K457DRAFT_132938 [Linnemannia elongata AG-77]|uniref:F-box domain-containing protein n=1 Tax=Linnemannia elongata AG-77 TaxID=1314771 RepID=A0A197KFA1_9FUNG|nr:hypothetical protein K457DRAFT_132938 [Linnemannia elongata AG-77]